MSCDFGNFDIAGFPKPHAYWYAANWLQGFGAGEPGRPPLPFKTVARVLELPGAPTGPDATGSISAITTAPFAELFLDGVGQGVLPTPRNARGEIQGTEWSVATPVAGPSGRGDTVAAKGSCSGAASFPINASGVQCHGLQRSESGDKFPDACAKACCADIGCDTWQLETSAEKICWIGRAAEGVGKCGAPRKGTWAGGQRASPPTPPPSPPSPPAPPFRNATLVAWSADPARVLPADSGAAKV